MAVGSGFSTTNSSQQLMNADSDSVTASGSVISSIDGDDGVIDVTKRPSSQNSHQYNGIASITYSEWFAVGVLCFVNLINYMDRFTIAGKWCNCCSSSFSNQFKLWMNFYEQTIIDEALWHRKLAIEMKGGESGRGGLSEWRTNFKWRVDYVPYEGCRKVKSLNEKRRHVPKWFHTKSQQNTISG